MTTTTDTVKKAQINDMDMKVAQAMAAKIMGDAKKLLEQTGLEVSLICRAPSGARWPVWMLEVGENYSVIEKVRGGER
jgi:hypothetical protein